MLNKEKLEREKQNHTSQKGITLIALIITIIVMLILVGVTINVALNGGLFDKAKDAKEKTAVATEKEQLLNAVFATLDDNGKIHLDNIELPTEDWSGTGGTYTSPSGNTFTVTEDGKISDVEETVIGYKVYKTSDGGIVYILFENGTFKQLVEGELLLQASYKEEENVEMVVNGENITYEKAFFTTFFDDDTDDGVDEFSFCGYFEDDGKLYLLRADLDPVMSGNNITGARFAETTLDETIDISEYL